MSIKSGMLILLMFACAGCAVESGNQFRNPLLAEKYLAQGNEALGRGGVHGAMEARAMFELAQENAPGDARVLDGFGCIDFLLGKYASAEKFYTSAIIANPGYGRAYANLARALEVQGKFAEAEKYYRRSLELNPNDIDARNNFAVFTARRKGIDATVLQELFKADAAAAGRDTIVTGNRQRATLQSAQTSKRNRIVAPEK